MAHLSHPTLSLRRTAAPVSDTTRSHPPGLSWLQRWLLGQWQAACRRAERPGRTVPRY